MFRASLSLLIVDCNPGSLAGLSTVLAQPGLEIFTASNAEEGLSAFARRRPALVLSELELPEGNGLQVLDRIMEIDPAAVVVLMAAEPSAESVVRAIRNGARDFLDKRAPTPRLLERIGVFVEEVRKRRPPVLGADAVKDPIFDGMIGQSQPMLDMFTRIRRIAPHYRSLLITGETGTGKDLVARAIHRLSPAASHRFVVVNCSAVVETLFESELFGHVRGAFTGATQDKPGLFEHAHGGTLFLDEIGDMPLATQAKLLRVLQDQEVQRVGTLHANRVNVRVIAATNHDLHAAIASKRFREDLYYRLSMVEIQTPPLAQRKEDLPLLRDHFVQRFSAQYGKQIRGLTERAEVRLAQHSWPGNVRELENVIGHATMLAMSDRIDLPDFHAYLQGPSGAPENPALSFPEPDRFAVQERLLVVRALEQVGWNQTQAARILRISRDRLRYKIKKHKLYQGNSAASA